MGLYKFKEEKKWIPEFIFSVDVEAMGLYGIGFAVGIAVYDKAGETVEEHLFSVDPKTLFNKVLTPDERWVMENVPPMEPTHTEVHKMRADFWNIWIKWQEKGAVMLADCLAPVESNFLRACVDDKLLNGQNVTWDAPYPVLDVATVLAVKGMDPTAQYVRLENELPIHHPLNDARQAGRMYFWLTKELRE